MIYRHAHLISIINNPCTMGYPNSLIYGAAPNLMRHKVGRAAAGHTVHINILIALQDL